MMYRMLKYAIRPVSPTSEYVKFYLSNCFDPLLTLFHLSTLPSPNGRYFLVTFDRSTPAFTFFRDPFIQFMNPLSLDNQMTPISK